jgi:hypothetical protein
LFNAIAAPSIDALKRSSWYRIRVTRSARSVGLRSNRGRKAPTFPHTSLLNVRQRSTVQIKGLTWRLSLFAPCPTLLARCGIDFLAGLDRLHHGRKAGAVTCVALDFGFFRLRAREIISRDASNPNTLPASQAVFLASSTVCSRQVRSDPRQIQQKVVCKGPPEHSAIRLRMRRAGRSASVGHCAPSIAIVPIACLADLSLTMITT